MHTSYPPNKPMAVRDGAHKGELCWSSLVLVITVLQAQGCSFLPQRNIATQEPPSVQHVPLAQARPATPTWQPAPRTAEVVSDFFVDTVPHQGGTNMNGGWQINAGDSVRQTIDFWASQAGWALVWAPTDDFSVLAGARFDGTFESAVQKLFAAIPQDLGLRVELGVNNVPKFVYVTRGRN